MSKFSIKDFNGVIPAAITPFDINENIDLDATREFTEFLLGHDIHGLYLTGSTGEGFLMKSEERMKVVETVMEVAKDKVPVVVHVGNIGTKRTIELARHAKEAGATAISSVPPFYWHFDSKQIFNYYKDIAEAVDIPMIIYNVPLAGVLPISLIKELGKIDNIVGVKYTNTDIYQIPVIKDELGDDFMIYGGADELASSNILVGVDGIVGSFYNLFPGLFVDIYNAVKNDNVKEAYKLQEKAVRLINYVVSTNNMVAGIKSILRDAGINAGYARKPFLNFYDKDQEQLSKGIIEIADKYDINGVTVIDKLREKYQG
ncbi:dihydrodipicolinate synthase family protein [Anaerococcus vaginimassiliensis]|uniref:dihydrodipicolinate synthase family protein n=1 Tax=Anaerococcus vaginimassiliensis TaxID=2042308 RepID=UPI0010303E4E|nr:dihydrodipicolinate synthase family protein [Anaerococcus vaginimassiliensis]